VNAFRVSLLGSATFLLACGSSVEHQGVLSEDLCSLRPNVERLCVTVEVGELTKAAGAIACLTGVLWREPAEPR
jgi:hypothetical protein